MPGPPPVPTAILAARGSRLARKRANEPRPPLAAPTCPQWLSGEERAAWRQIVPLLRTLGALARIDGNALARYCCLWVRWKQAHAFIRKYGESYPVKDVKKTGHNAKGKPVYEESIRCFMPFPQVTLANQLAKQLLSLEQQFGLTPSARSRLNVAVSDPAPPNSRLRFFNPAAKQA